MVEVPAHKRRNEKPPSETDQSLRFDPSVPVEEILIENKGIKNSDDYTVVGEKVTCRLAQRPSSYVVLRFVRNVYKRKDNDTFSCPLAPPAVLEKSCADVSFLTGLLIDKFAYHLPLYRQHQRLETSGVHLTGSTRAGEALAMIADLYKIEPGIKAKCLSPEKVLEQRTQRAKPIVDTFFEWLRTTLETDILLPPNPFTIAARYALAREDGLRVFLEYPDIQLDTNHLERAIRIIAMGRKNYLFCWTELSAEHVGIIQSLLLTCRVQGIDPYTYLVDVLQRLDTHLAKDVEQLTPRVWKEMFAENPLRSDIDRMPVRNAIRS